MKEPQTSAELMALFERLKALATGDRKQIEKAELAEKLAKWLKPELVKK